MFAPKKLPPQEQAKEWKKSLRQEKRGIERQIHKIETEEERIKQKVKLLMRQGHTDAVMPLVKSLAESKRARSHLLKTCTQLDSLARQIDLQVAEVKVMGCFKQSAEITHMLNMFVKLPEMQATMQKLSMEMERAGLAAEMLDDAMEEVNGTVEPEDEEAAVRMIYNSIAKDVQKATGKPVKLMPVTQEEIAENPLAAKIAQEIA